MHDACKRGNVSFLEEAIASGVSVNVSFHLKLKPFNFIFVILSVFR